MLSSYLHSSFLDEFIEEDLEAKAIAILMERGIDHSNVKVHGHHLDDTFASGLSNSVIEELDGVIGIYLPPESGSKYVQPIDPAIAATVKHSSMDFRVERRDGTIYVSGGLPDRKYQSNLLYLLNANANDSLVVNETVIAENPDYEFWWDSQVNNIIPDFLNGSEGDGHLHFMAYDFEASATFNKESEYQSIKSKFEKLPHTVIKDTDITYVEPVEAPIIIPEVITAAVLNPPRLFVTEDANDNIVIRGTVDSEQTKNELIVAAKVAIPTGKNVNFTQKLSVASSTAPFSSLPSIKSLLSFHIQNSKTAEIAYTADGLKLEGSLSNEEQKLELLRLAKRIANETLKLETNLTVDTSRRGSPLLQEGHEQLLANSLKPLPVYFETNSSKIKVAQEYKVKKIAEIIKEFKNQNLNLIVGGYADSRDNLEQNKALSLKRANVVRDELIEYGVPSDRLIVEYVKENVSALPQDQLWKVQRVAITISGTK